MFERLKKLQENSYVPVTNFRTAAVVKMIDGKEFFGVNVENPSFRDGMCAEQVAIASACSAGYKKGDFVSMSIITDGKTVSTPCFLCRQFIVELFAKEVMITCYDTEGKYKVYSVEELCPYPFDESDLK